MYRIVLSREARKDYDKLKAAHLLPKVKLLLDLIIQHPFETPPPLEKLVGNLSGCYSRRINIQHRLVYTVDETNRIVHILRMWTHYQ